VTITKEQKRARWAKVIKQWKESGESQSRYCQIHNIKLHQLTYWAQVSKPAHRAEASENHSGFVSVQIPDSQPVGLTIRLPNGLQLEGVTLSNLGVVQQIIGWSS